MHTTKFMGKAVTLTFERGRADTKTELEDVRSISVEEFNGVDVNVQGEIGPAAATLLGYVLKGHAEFLFFREEGEDEWIRVF